MERQPRDHDVDACLLGRVASGRIGDATPDGLEDERKDVAADEDNGVRAGFEAGEGFAVDDDDTGEGQIDGGGDEAGGYCQDDEVPVLLASVSS